MHDKENPDDEMQCYTIHYYLADDTVDILEAKAVNSGKDSFPKLLNKMKVPKNWKDMPCNICKFMLKKTT